MRLRSALAHAAPVLSITGAVALVALMVVVPGRAVAWSDAAVASQSDPCTAEGTAVEPTNVAEVEALLVGTWVLCGDASLFGPVADGEVGVQYAPDGSYHRVYEAADGGLISAGGLDQQGTWTVGDDSAAGGTGVFEVSHRRADGGTVGAIASFFDEPRLMELEGMNGPVGYVPWTGADPEPGVPPGSEGPCGPPGAPVALTTAEDVEGVLVGTWMLCDGVSPLLSPDGSALGFELRADGTWSHVYEGPDGSLIAALGADQEGTWTVVEEQLSIEMRILGSGTAFAFPAMTEDPTVLRLTGMEGFGDYLPWRGAPPVPGPPPGTDTGAGGGSGVDGTTTTVPTEVAGESVVSDGSGTLPRTGGGSVIPVAVAAVLVTSLGLVSLGLARRDR